MSVSTRLFLQLTRMMARKCGGIRVSHKASCTRRSRHKHDEQNGSARARPELNQVSKKELLFCVCLRHTLSTSLARIPCGSTTICSLLEFQTILLTRDLP
jgi:hypothetical protein